MFCVWHFGNDAGDADPRETLASIVAVHFVLSFCRLMKPYRIHSIRPATQHLYSHCSAVGHTSIVHGGAIAMALDESFGHAFMSLGYLASFQPYL